MEDTSAIADGFLDNTFAQNQNIPLIPLDKPLRLKVVDSRDSSAGAITHYAEVDLLIGYYSERIKLYVTKLACYNIILGYTWLRKHNPYSDHGDGFICFNSNYCKEFCLPSNIHQEVVKTIGHLPPLHPAPQRFLLRQVNATAFDILSK
jgi:hypothetical protein